MDQVAADSEDVRHLLITLPADGELVITAPLNEKRITSFIKLQPSVGTNEPRVDIHGAPLIVDIGYKLLPGSVVHVFAWSAATVQITGSEMLLRNIFRSPTRSITRPLVEYHCMLHPLRARAEKSGMCGPIVLVCGAAASGKEMMALSLCSYATRSGWKPLLVDLDCGASQMVGVPGSIGAAMFEFPLCVDENISLNSISTTYFVGTTEPQIMTVDGDGGMVPAYSHYAHLLLGCIQNRLTRHTGNVYGASGAIVHLPELRGNAGVNFVSDIINRYDVSNVLCSGDDYLFHKLIIKFGTPLPGEGGAKTVIDRISKSYCAMPPYPAEVMLPIKFNEYFNGSGSINLYPSQWSKPLGSLDIFQLKDENEQVVLGNVEGEELKGIVGCIGALFLVNKSSSALLQSPLAYVRVQSIEPSGVFFLTTTHYTFPSEKMCLIVGSVRWITSLM